jgi:hypothetical protein
MDAKPLRVSRQRGRQVVAAHQSASLKCSNRGARSIRADPCDVARIGLRWLMAANRHDYRISFADGRIVEISNCACASLARLRGSIYHPASAIVKVEMLGDGPVKRAKLAVRNRAGRFLTEKTDSDLPDNARRARTALRGGEHEVFTSRSKPTTTVATPSQRI